MADDTPSDVAASGGAGGEAAFDIGVVCVTHNSATLIDELVSGVELALDDLRPLLVFVDSGSADRTAAVVRERAPGAQFVDLDGNRGFSAGINAGIERVRELGGARAYAIVNPDMALDAHCLARLAAAVSRPGVGIAAPRLRDEHGALLPSLRAAPRVLASWCDAMLGGPTAARLRLPTEVIRDEKFYRADQVAGWATGGMLVVSERCSRAVGAWDESFFMYEEEVDFALRAAAAGYALAYVADASARRTIGSTTVAPWAHALMRANRVELVRRGAGAAPAMATRLAFLVGDALRVAMGREAPRAAVWSLLRPWSPAAIMARYRQQANAVIASAHDRPNMHPHARIAENTKSGVRSHDR